VGLIKRNITTSSYDVIIGTAKASEVISKTPYKNLWILPASSSLGGADIELADMTERDSRLKRGLLQVVTDYDYIIIDCPPWLGLLTLNGLVAADGILVPIQCEFYALDGMTQLMATTRQVKRLYNPTLELEGVLLTMYDPRQNLTLQVAEEIKKFFPQKVYSVVVPKNVRLAEAPSHGQPIMYYDRASKGAAAYSDLAEEILRSHRGVRN
jgi:chromosome partitioning protein